MNFLDLGLSEKTVKAINECGIEKPTTVQVDVIPAILQGKDIFTIAPGGCGKTVSYVLPLIDIISRREKLNILIMTSDSQKSVTISDSLAMLNRFHEETEEDADGEEEGDVIIGSPDLLVDLVNEGQIDLSKINILVVDDINLIKKNKQIKNMEKLLEMMPADKQNIVYTNRRSKETQSILDKILKAPEEIKVDKNKEQEAKMSAPAEARPAKPAAPAQQLRNAAPDPEALALCKKYNSFQGKTQNFCLTKSNWPTASKTLPISKTKNSPENSGEFF